MCSNQFKVRCEDANKSPMKVLWQEIILRRNMEGNKEINHNFENRWSDIRYITEDGLCE
jgi:hypothetical protein